MKIGTYIVYNSALKEIDFLDKPVHYNDEVIGKIIGVK